MARIFISYSRDDEEFARRLAHDLERVGADVWIDVEDIRAGLPWADSIQEALDACEIMLVIISPEAMASRNVADEWQYNVNQGFAVIPVLLREARVHFQLHRLQYVDFLNQDYDIAFAQLHSELRRKGIYLNPISPRDELVPLPEQQPLPEGDGGWPALRYWALAMVIFGVLVIVVLNLGGGDGKDATPSPTRTESSVAVLTTNTATGEPVDTKAPTNTLQPTLDIAEIVGTLDVQATMEQATLDVQATAAARATEYSAGTQSVVDQTATATLWTLTPTPNVTASIDAYRTQQAATITQAWIDSWTATPTSTHTPTPTPDPLVLARGPVVRNADWQPVIQVFDGVEMVLVPVGCFMMGSNQNDDERPVHRVCFDEPFWIDRTEVSNGQFAVFNGQAALASQWTESNRPRESITWFEAVAFCELRGARLATEAEWEYVARGPDGLIYPWGNEWQPGKVVWSGNSNDQAANVGSRPTGASWVGAVDMSGNVWEWVADWYDADHFEILPDDIVNPPGPESGEYRVLRGGSWVSTVTAEDVFRATNRYFRNPYLSNFNFGFRCARSG